MELLLVLGKNQYGDPDRGLSTEYLAFEPAFKNIGVDVKHFESWQRDEKGSFYNLNMNLLNYVVQKKPDAIFFVIRLYEIWTETLDAIRDLGITTICWTTDDSWKYDIVSKYIGKHFDLITTTYPHIVPRYYQDNIKNVMLTQWAANSDSLQAPIAAEDCKYQVTFVGAAHGNRLTRVKMLQSMGVPLQCFGRGWESGSIDAEMIPKIMRESVISLNFANSLGENQIKARTFEVPGAGGFLITDDAAHLENWYVPDDEIIIAKDDVTMAQKILYYLDNPSERDQIAMAGYSRTMHNHTYEMRLKEILEKAFENSKGSPVKPETTVCSEFLIVAQKHNLSPLLRLSRGIFVSCCQLIWGKQRGPRAARQIVFEISRRLLGSRVFTAQGLPGRLFYKES
jgi:spore maturation protein CgeB